MGRAVHYFDHITPSLGDTDKLTPRRAQVLELVAQGLTTEDIAHKLGLAEDTVRTHIESLRNQFHALNRVELIYQACAHGVLNCDARLAAGLQVRATFKALPATPIDLQAFRAQSRTKQRPRCVSLTSAQKAVAPVFTEQQEGCADYFDIPAYMRKRLHREIEDIEFAEQQKMVAYARKVAERLFNHPKIEAA